MGMAIDPDFSLCIYSSRSKNSDQLSNMQSWLLEHIENHIKNLRIQDDTHPFADANAVFNYIAFPTEKPAAWLTIDDRAICFDGDFPSKDSIHNFKPWNKP